MKIPQETIVIGSALAAILALIYLAKQAAELAGGAVTSAAQAVNPINPDNVFTSAVNATGAAITGDDSFSLGAEIYNLTHSDPFNNSSEAPEPGDSPSTARTNQDHVSSGGAAP